MFMCVAPFVSGHVMCGWVTQSKKPGEAGSFFFSIFEVPQLCGSNDFTAVGNGGGLWVGIWRLGGAVSIFLYHSMELELIL